MISLLSIIYRERARGNIMARRLSYRRKYKERDIFRHGELEVYLIYLTGWPTPLFGACFKIHGEQQNKVGRAPPLVTSKPFIYKYHINAQIIQ